MLDLFSHHLQIPSGNSGAFAEPRFINELKSARFFDEMNRQYGREEHRSTCSFVARTLRTYFESIFQKALNSHGFAKYLSHSA